MENPLNKPIVNHINGKKDDNRLENLEFVTQQENIQHAYDTGLVPERGRKKIQFEKNNYNNQIRQFDSIKDAAKHFGRKNMFEISRCCNQRSLSAYGFSWRYLEEI